MDGKVLDSYLWKPADNFSSTAPFSDSLLIEKHAAAPELHFELFRIYQEKSVSPDIFTENKASCSLISLQVGAASR